MNRNISVKTFKRFSKKFGTAAFFLALLFSSCKDEGLVGLEIQPEGSQSRLFTTDTISLTTYTIEDDSVRTDETLLNLLGSYVDPEFGFSRADFYTQFRLSRENLNFGDLSDIQVDSLVLSLRYWSHYGDESTPQNFKVFQINSSEDFDRGNEYYADTELELLPTAIGSADNVTVTPGDSVKVGDVFEPTQIRIPMTTEFAQYLIDGAANGDYTDNDSFTEYLKGVRVTAETTGQVAGEGAVYSFDLESAFSRMTLYYTQISTGDDFSFDYLINDSAARVNRYIHDHTGSNAGTALENQDEGKQLVYLQAMASTKAVFELPSLEGLAANGPVIVNRAEVVLPIHNADWDDYLPPAELNMVGIDASGGQIFTRDYFETDAHYGGVIDSANSEYRFRITRFVQEVLNTERDILNAGQDENNIEKVNFGLRIIPGASAINANRVILKGNENSDGRMRLILSYTPLNQ